MRVSILCPTRERPERAERMMLSALQDNTDDVEVLLYVADNDPRLKYYTDNNALHGAITIGQHVSTCQAWNTLYTKCRGNLIMLGADDIIFDTPGWAGMIRERAERYIDTPHVFHFKDSRHPTNTPHPIVTREWAKLMGWFLPPWFNHYYVDSFTCWVAKLAGVFTEIHDVLLVHDKDQSSSQRFPWTREWLAEDRQSWSTACPQMEQALTKVLRATGR